MSKLSRASGSWCRDWGVYAGFYFIGWRRKRHLFASPDLSKDLCSLGSGMRLYMLCIFNTRAAAGISRHRTLLIMYKNK